MRTSERVRDRNAVDATRRRLPTKTVPRTGEIGNRTEGGGGGSKKRRPPPTTTANNNNRAALLPRRGRGRPAHIAERGAVAIPRIARWSEEWT